MISDTSAQDIFLLPPRSRTPLWLAVSFLAIALLTWASWHFKDVLAGGTSFSRDRLTFATVELGDLTRDVAAEGRVVAAAAPALYAGSGGSVTFDVQPGNVVKIGQVLARITSPELLANLAQARSTADALKSDWLRAIADTRQTRAAAEAGEQIAALALTTTENDFSRQTRAFEAGAVAGMAVDQASDAMSRARIAHKQAILTRKLKDDVMRFEITARRQAYERALLQTTDLQRQEAELSLHAPVDGQVGQIFVADRSTIAKDAKLLTVIDLTQLEVQVHVAESQARELAPGMPGEISGNGQHWRGHISSVSPEVVNGEVAAQLRFDGVQPESLRQNQRLSVRILLDHRERVLNIDRGSFVEEGGGRWAYLVKGNVAVKHPIRLGVQSLTQVEVLEGLNAGDKIIIAGSDVFKNADRVQLIK